MATMTAKDGSTERVRGLERTLLDLSHRIHAHPELAFEEERAAGWLGDAADAAGLTVTRGVAGVPTALVAEAGSGPLTIAVCAEYDALPDIGHACGHNVIAASALGAAAALARVADDVGITVRLVGTPAEESGGGKIVLLERGVFDGVHLAMMVHPAPIDVERPPMIAISEFDVCYHGKSAHASAFPERGINAADALTIAQTAIGLLRQHIRPTDRIHGIVTRGGEAPNVVPALTSARYVARASTLAGLDEIKGKVLRCFEAGALATGATMTVEDHGAPYAEVAHDADLASLYRRHAETLGRSFLDLGHLLDRSAGSTDMGNVSQVIPSIHPMIGIESLPAVNHQPEFTAACATPSADRAVLDGALALAWTAIDAAETPALRSRLLARG